MMPRNTGTTGKEPGTMKKLVLAGVMAVSAVLALTPNVKGG